MLIKPRQTKELKLRINIELIYEIDQLATLAKSAGFTLDVNAGFEKFLEQELPKIRKRLENQIDKSTVGTESKK